MIRLKVGKKLGTIVAVVLIVVVGLAFYLNHYFSVEQEAARLQEWKDTLVIGTTWQMQNADPQIAARAGLDHHILYLISNSIFWSPADQCGAIKGCLAESYQVKSEMINDSKSYYIEVKLREGLHFNDGEEITADDTVYSFHRCYEVDPTVVSIYNTAFDFERFGYDTWVVVDKYTLKMRVPSSFPMHPIAINGLACISVPLVSRSAAEKYGEGLGTSTYGLSGPLIMKECDIGDKIVLEVREDYITPGTNGWVEGMGGMVDWPPKWKQCIWRMYADSAALAMALKTGEVDISYGMHSVGEIKELMDDETVDVHTSSLGATRFLMMNYANPPFDDLKVRKAIVLALDPMENIEKTKLGMASPAYSPVHEDYPYYTPVFQDMYQLFGHRTEEKLDEARALLAEAGYSDGLKITMSVGGLYGTEEEEKSDALIIQSQLADIGIDLEVKIMDAGTWKMFKNEGKLEMYMAGFYPDYPDPFNDVSSMAADSWNGRQYHWSLILNETAFPDSRGQEYYALWNECRDLWDPNISPEQNIERRDNFIKQQEITAECVYYIPYYRSEGYICTRTYVKNFSLHWSYTDLSCPGILAVYKESPES